jgi:hypothetical protein
VSLDDLAIAEVLLFGTSVLEILLTEFESFKSSRDAETDIKPAQRLGLVSRNLVFDCSQASWSSSWTFRLDLNKSCLVLKLLTTFA